MKKCPYCAENIKEKAVKCRYCKETLSNSSQASIKNNTALYVLVGFGTILVVLMFIIVFAGDPNNMIAINEQQKYEEDSVEKIIREADFGSIRKSLNSYVDDGRGFTPDREGDVIPTCPMTIEIGTGEEKGRYFDLYTVEDLVPTYILSIPFDPYNGSNRASGYNICETNSFRSFQVSSVAVD